MRVLLLYANPNQSAPVSPYGLDIIRSTLRARVPRAETLTINPFIEHVDPEAYLAAVLDAYAPDLVALSIRNIDNAIVAVSGETPPDGSPIDIVAYAPAVRGLVKILREWRADLACVVGGAGFTACPAEFLDYLDLDYGLIGPAEEAFARLTAELADLRPPHRGRIAEILATLPGAIVRQEGGFLRSRAAASLGSERAAPIGLAPEYQLLYRLRNIPVAVRTKTGCPLRCSYCTDPINVRRTDRRPLDNVIAEIRHTVEEHGLASFHIADAELNLPYEDHLLDLCARLRDSGLAGRIRWRGYFNVTPFSDELVEAISSAGCESPSFAVDSFHEPGLRAHRKNFRLGQVHDVLNRLLAHGAGIRPEVCLLLGGPGETRESIETNIRWMQHYAERGVQIAYSCGIRVYPNTPLAGLPLDAAHLYRASGRAAGTGRMTFPPGDLLREAVVYCEPFAPRELARYLAERLGGYPGISVFVDWPWPEARYADELRRFNVGVYNMAHGRLGEAAGHFSAVLRDRPEMAAARAALKIIDSVVTA
jgi:radical SAM superfamily enzyme YgiQ (UPF0313 family)